MFCLRWSPNIVCTETESLFCAVHADRVIKRSSLGGDKTEAREDYYGLCRITNHSIYVRVSFTPFTTDGDKSLVGNAR